MSNTVNNLPPEQKLFVFVVVIVIWTATGLATTYSVAKNSCFSFYFVGKLLPKRKIKIEKQQIKSYRKLQKKIPLFNHTIDNDFHFFVFMNEKWKRMHALLEVGSNKPCRTTIDYPWLQGNVNTKIGKSKWTISHSASQPPPLNMLHLTASGKNGGHLK